jgi:hypothetical protein
LLLALLTYQSPTKHVPISLLLLLQQLGATSCACRIHTASVANQPCADPSSLLQQLGATTYACRIPERWFPGKFDIMGHSHQLWHAAVVLAAWVHYLAIMILLQWRDAAGDECSQTLRTGVDSASGVMCWVVCSSHAGDLGAGLGNHDRAAATLILGWMS